MATSKISVSAGASAAAFEINTIFPLGYPALLGAGHTGHAGHTCRRTEKGFRQFMPRDRCDFNSGCDGATGKGNSSGCG